MFTRVDNDISKAIKRLIEETYGPVEKSTLSTSNCLQRYVFSLGEAKKSHCCK